MTQRTTATGGNSNPIVETFTYDVVGNLTESVPGRGQAFATVYVYDRRNRIISLTRNVGTAASPVLATEQTVYDDEGRAVETDDALGHRTVRGYDRIDRVISETIYSNATGGGQLDSTWAYQYFSGGLRVTKSDPLGSVAQVTTYNGLNRIVQVDQREQGTTIYTYDAVGNLKSSQTGTVVRKFDYDKLNRRTDTYDEAGNAAHVDYDEVGNVILSRDAMGNVTKYTYDRRNRQTHVLDPLGGDTVTAYDGAGNVTSVTDPLSNVTTYTYDLANRRLTDSIKSGVRTYSYDADGNLIDYTDRDGREILYTYDGANRRVSKIVGERTRHGSWNQYPYHL